MHAHDYRDTRIIKASHVISQCGDPDLMWHMTSGYGGGVNKDRVDIQSEGKRQKKKRDEK